MVKIWLCWVEELKEQNLEIKIIFFHISVGNRKRQSAILLIEQVTFKLVIL